MQGGMNNHLKNHQVICPLCGRRAQDNGSGPDQVLRAIRRRTHQVEALLEGLLRNSARRQNQSNGSLGHRQNFLSLMKTIERYRASISQTTLQLKSMQAAAKRGPISAERTERNGLSPREREIVRCLAQGLSNKGTASELGINVRTVETHRARIMLKLSLGSLAELVQYAIRADLIDV
jgi:DNA-binding NarL/FixJ family response regulator